MQESSTFASAGFVRTSTSFEAPDGLVLKDRLRWADGLGTTFATDEKSTQYKVQKPQNLP